jgi:hypothetical protein
MEGTYLYDYMWINDNIKMNIDKYMIKCKWS